MTSMYENAMRFANHGWAVFPLVPKDKKPITTNGLHAATTAHAQINAWWTQYPTANIGIRTGQVSGFFVLDIDGEDGEQSLRALENQYGALPPSVEIITGGGGRHLYFKQPTDIVIKNSAGTIGTGLDIRGDGGYVVAPPSIHPSGKKYEWSVDCDHDITPPPQWLIALITAKPAPKSQGSGGHEYTDLLSPIPEGKRNSSLARLAGILLASNLSPFLSLRLCHAWNQSICKPPLTDNEVDRTVDSIAGLELQKHQS